MRIGLNNVFSEHRYSTNCVVVGDKKKQLIRSCKTASAHRLTLNGTLSFYLTLFFQEA